MIVGKGKQRLKGMERSCGTKTETGMGKKGQR